MEGALPKEFLYHIAGMINHYTQYLQNNPEADDKALVEGELASLRVCQGIFQRTHSEYGLSQDIKQ